MTEQERTLTGRKVLLIAIGAFAIIFGANMALLFSATGSFPGLVVKNSYVASQGWDARTAAQRALGWTAEVGHREERLRVRLTDSAGGPVSGLSITATVGRPATSEADITVILSEQDGGYEIPLPLGAGNWRVDLRTQDHRGTAWEATARLFVRGGA